MLSADLYVIEGGDAAGKATQAALLAEYLESKVVSFPRYDTPHGQLIKDLLNQHVGTAATPAGLLYGTASLPRRREAQVLQALMTYDRYSCADLWKPGPLVLDRYWMSAAVYGWLDGLDHNELQQVHRALPAPRIAILLTVDPEVQVERLKSRGRPIDRYEAQLATIQQVQARYQALWRERQEVDEARFWPIIDGNGTVKQVHESVLRAVAAVGGAR